MKIYNKEVEVHDFEDAFGDFCVEVHYDEDATRFYLYHRTMPNVKVFMVDALPIKYDDEISDLIASTIEEFLGIVFADEDIA